MTAQPTTRISTSPYGPQQPPVPGVPQQPHGFPQSYGPASYGPGHPAPFTPPPAPPAPTGRRTGKIVGIVAAVLVVLGGLGAAALFLFGPRTVDPQSVQQEIVRITQNAVQVAPADVRCPDEIKAETGGTFTCTATVDGQPVTYKVHQDDEKGHLTINFDRLIKVADLQSGVADLVGKDIDVPVNVTCEPAGRVVLVNTPGSPIACTAINAADPTDSAQITVTVAGDGTPAYTFV
jgi:uncharacterized protein DUF4333